MLFWWDSPPDLYRLYPLGLITRLASENTIDSQTGQGQVNLKLSGDVRGHAGIAGNLFEDRQNKQVVTRLGDE